MHPQELNLDTATRNEFAKSVFVTRRRERFRPPRALSDGFPTGILVRLSTLDQCTEVFLRHSSCAPPMYFCVLHETLDGYVLNTASQDHPSKLLYIGLLGECPRLVPSQEGCMAKRGRPNKHGAKPGWILFRSAMVLAAYDKARAKGEKHS